MEPVFYICFELHVSGLVRDEECPVHRGKTRADCACLPSSEAVGATGIEMLFKRKGGGIAVCISCPSKKPCRHCLSVPLAESPSLCHSQLCPDILRKRRVPDHSCPQVVLVHQRLEGAENIAGYVKLKPRVEIRSLWVYIGIGRVVECAAEPHVKVVLVGISHERV